LSQDSLLKLTLVAGAKWDTENYYGSFNTMAPDAARTGASFIILQRSPRRLAEINNIVLKNVAEEKELLGVAPPYVLLNLNRRFLIHESRFLNGVKVPMESYWDISASGEVLGLIYKAVATEGIREKIVFTANEGFTHDGEMFGSEPDLLEQLSILNKSLAENFVELPASDKYAPRRGASPGL
jgi:hypothetical protein